MGFSAKILVMIAWLRHFLGWTVSACRSREDLVLEAVVEDIDNHFKMIEIAQLYRRGDYADNFQCAYDEALLSADGQTVIERRMNCVKGSGLVRFAFYLHSYDANLPLQWSYGQTHCPPVEPVSRRLKYLVPYRACN